MGTYLRPADLPEALDALAAGVREGRPRVVVAGATDHYPARVGRVVDEDILDISGLTSFRTIRHDEGGWWIPCGVTWADLAQAELPPVFNGLRRAATAVGGVQIQNRGTIVGNLCNASPAADGLPVLLTLDAAVELVSAEDQRAVPVSDFVTGNRATVRAPNEIATGLFIPEPMGEARSTFLKLGSRAYLVISIAMVAAVLVLDRKKLVTSARIAVGACSAVALRLPELERELVGRAATPGLETLVRPEHLAALTPIDDVRGTAAYRLEAAGVLVQRAIAELVE